MSVIISFLIIILLILLNGMFVAAEFAIIGVRPTRIEQLAEEGNRTARWVRDVVKSSGRTDRYIATAQLGITLASLGLGMYAEPSIAHLIEAPLEHYLGLEGAAVHTISFIIALTIITYLHVVVGEMVPKSLALQSAERVVLFLATPMQFAGKIFSWPVTVLNRIGVLVLKLLRVPPPRQDQHLYTPDELELIVSESVAGGMLEEREQEMVANIFDFHERRAGQVMVPRTRMAAIPVDITESELLALFARTPHSRLPVYRGDVDHIIGMLHLKDFVRQQLSDQPFALDPLLRQIPFVPESQYVETLLASFKRLHLHMAIVIDEHGGVAGLVTLEDLIEEVFGEVRDEFDTGEEEPLLVLAPGHIRAQGTVLLDDLAEEVTLGEHDYANDVNTIGGLVMAELGRPPQAGDVVKIGDVSVQVEDVDGMAIKHVILRFDPDQSK